MAYTNADLVLDVLAELFADSEGQSPTAYESDKILRRLDGIIASLATRNIIALTSDAIDDDAYDPLVKYVAEVVAPHVGSRPTDKAAKADAEAELRLVYRAPRGISANLKVDNGLIYRTRRWSISG